MNVPKPGTALPWTLDASDFPLIINSPDDGTDDGPNCICIVHEYSDAGGRRFAFTTEVAAANAAYIVTACNAFPDLVRVLRAVRGWMADDCDKAAEMAVAREIAAVLAPFDKDR